MKKGSFGGLLIIAALAAAFLIYLLFGPVDVKQHYVVGVINPNTGAKEITRGFIDGLASYNYVEGGNLTILRCENLDEVDTALKDMVSRKVDLIFTVTTPTTEKARETVRGKNIPVIFSVHDPVSSGIIKRLAHPGDNITGIQNRGSVPKALEWLLTLAPQAKHIFVPVKFDTMAARQSLADLRKTADSLGITLTVSSVNNMEELDKVLSSMPKEIDALFVLHSVFIYSHMKKIVDAAMKAKLPVGGGAAQFERGATISYGFNTYRTGKQASRLANMVLHGQSAAGIPAEISNFFLGINLKTAQASGVKIPNDILIQADFIKK